MKWIETGFHKCKCSTCNTEFTEEMFYDNPVFNFCPACGDVVEDEWRERMTKEKAIKILQGEKRHSESHLQEAGKAPAFYKELQEYVDACELAIKALGQTDVPETNVGELISLASTGSTTGSSTDSSTIRSCGDCISREAVRQLIWRNNDKYGYSDRFHEFTEECLKLPAVNQAKVGHWIEYKYAEESEGHLISNFVCDKCHAWTEVDYAYCPNCGVKMEVDR